MDRARTPIKQAIILFWLTLELTERMKLGLNLINKVSIQRPYRDQHVKLAVNIKNMMCVTGKVGITVNINWYESKDGQPENIEAAERALQFLGGWIANPIYGSGDYPQVMIEKVDLKIDIFLKFS